MTTDAPSREFWIRYESICSCLVREAAVNMWILLSGRSRVVPFGQQVCDPHCARCRSPHCSFVVLRITTENAYMGRLIVEQIISADGYAADVDGGIGFFINARGINESDRDQVHLLEGM